MTTQTCCAARAAAGLMAVALSVSSVPAQQPAAAAAPDAITLTATSANVAEPGSAVRIRLFRWSTDAERTPLIAALNPPPAPAPARGLPAEADSTSPAAARGGRAGAAGRGGRGGRGRRGGGDAAPLTPIAALTAAIGRAPTIGYIWTNDVTGYAIKYAVRAPLPDGGERIILASDRRLGTHAAAWQPVTSAPLTDYEFTLIEMRLDPKGTGEAKTSLTTAVIVDKDAGTVALENYTAAPSILQHVKK